MKATDRFKETIQNYLNKRAEQDSLFAETLKKKDKNIDDCINYILNQVKQIGAQGYTDEEIFGLAVHYYDEDDIKKSDPVKMNVVINHKPELTDEEIEELKEQERNKVINEERRKMTTKKRKPSRAVKTQDKKENDQQSLF